MAEDHEVLQAGDPGEAPVADGDPGRPAGDDRDRSDLRGERGQRGDGAGVGAGLVGVGNDLGEGAVEVEGDDGSARCAEEGFEPLTSGGGFGHRQVVRIAPHTVDPNGPTGPRLRRVERRYRLARWASRMRRRRFTVPGACRSALGSSISALSSW